MPPPDRLASLLIPFRSSGSAQVLPQGYRLIQSPEGDLATEGETAVEGLNRLLQAWPTNFLSNLHSDSITLLLNLDLGHHF
jgi:hypothetical protein